MSTEKIQPEKKERDILINRIFFLGLEIGVIFAIPAFLGLWIGNQTGSETIRGLILLGSFIFSWVLVIYRYRQISSKLKNLKKEPEL